MSVSILAGVAELADAPDSKSGHVKTQVKNSPKVATKGRKRLLLPCAHGGLSWPRLSAFGRVWTSRSGPRSSSCAA